MILAGTIIIGCLIALAALVTVIILVMAPAIARDPEEEPRSELVTLAGEVWLFCGVCKKETHIKYCSLSIYGKHWICPYCGLDTSDALPQAGPVPVKEITINPTA